MKSKSLSVKQFSTLFKKTGEKSLALLLVFACLLTGLSVQAQKECGFDRVLEQRIAEDPSVRQQMEQMEAFTRKYIASANKSTGTVIVPTVVHVVHNGEAVGTYPNMSDAQINSAIVNLNQAFQNTAPYAGTSFYNNPMDVQFVLAQRTSQGTATTGIERHDVSSKSYDATYDDNGISTGGGEPGVSRPELFGDFYWNPQDYMNIWLVKKINGVDPSSSGSAGFLGFATLPGTNFAVNDGLVCQARAFGYFAGYDHANRPAGFDFGPFSQNINSTANHEVGHYLNLYHTFNGDENGTTCPPASGTVGTNDDGCNDISPHKRTSSVCPNYSATGNECDSGGNEYIHNFMNYSRDQCFQGFSGDQKARCEAAANGPRAAFKTSLGATAPASGSYPAAYAAAATSNPQPGSGIRSFTFEGVTVTSLGAVFAGNYLDRVATKETFALEYNRMYSMSVTAGQNGVNPEVVGVFIDYNGDDDLEDAGERIYQTAASDGKAGVAHTFSFTTPTTASSVGQQPGISPRLRMRIVSDFANGSRTINAPQQPLEIGQTQDFSVTLMEGVLPVELTSLEATSRDKFIELSWETATEESNDGFTIQRSMDGAAFTDIGFVAGTGDSDVAVRYNFNDTDVRPGTEYFYQLSQRDFDGTTMNSDVVMAKMKGAEGIAIFPNPATAELFISRGNGQEGMMKYEIFTTLGQRVAEGQTTDVTARVDVNNMVAGSYFVRVSTDGQEAEVKRLVISK